jgi:hypothetical protein
MSWKEDGIQIPSDGQERSGPHTEISIRSKQTHTTLSKNAQRMQDEKAKKVFSQLAREEKAAP